MVLIRSNRGKSRAVQKGGLLVLLSTQLSPATYSGMGETIVNVSVGYSVQGKVG